MCLWRDAGQSSLQLNFSFEICSVKMVSNGFKSCVTEYNVFYAHSCRKTKENKNSKSKNVVRAELSVNIDSLSCLQKCFVETNRPILWGFFLFLANQKPS